MVAATISGIVESVSIEQVEGYNNYSRYRRTDDIKIKVTLTLPDGRKAYISTKIADLNDGANGQWYHPSSAEAKAHGTSKLQWAYFLNNNVGPDRTGDYVISRERPVPAIWRDDEIMVRGTIEERTSSRGNRYLNVNRATLVARRPEGTALVQVA